MSPLHAFLLLLSYLSTGIIIPVLSLLLLARGCTLQTLPLMLGLYSLTGLCLEVPSGVFADWRGRKQTYLLSVFLTFLGLCVLLFAHSLPLVAASMLFWGASRAFSSGSLDALIIDDCLEREGAAALPQVSARLTVLQSGGIAAGALIGGLLPAWNDYAPHLIARLALLCLLWGLCALFLREPPRTEAAPELRKQLSACGALLRGNLPLWGLILCMGFLAGGMGLVEIYWQPALQSFLPELKGLWLGLLSVGGYLLLTAGGLWSGRIPFRSPRGRWRGYFLLQLLLGGGLLLLARQTGPAGFAAAYLLFYAVLGADGIQEQTLLNTLSDSRNRATVLSLASLVCQLGNLAFAASSSALVGPLGFGGVWALGGAAVAAVCGAVFVFGTRRGAFGGDSA